MRDAVAILMVLVLALAACGSSDDEPDSVAAVTCTADDPSCDNPTDPLAAPLGDSIALDNEGPLAINFGGFFYTDDDGPRLCASLAESFPPQCANLVIEIEGSDDVVIDAVANSFAVPDASRILTEGSVSWTDEWVNISGLLIDGKLDVES